MFNSGFCAFFLVVVLFGVSASGFYMHGVNSFLTNVTPVAFEQFRQICESANMTKSDVIGQLQNWATANSVRSQFDNATSVLQQRQQQMQSFVNSNFIGSALQLFNQYMSNLNDNSMTRVTECQNMRSMMANNNNNISTSSPADINNQQMLRQAVPMPPSTIPCPFYPPQCYRNIVPFVRRDEAQGPAPPGGVSNNDIAHDDIEVEFVKVPENMQTHITA